MIGKTVGHYRITSKLGAGGMGEVFLAEDTRLERRAAIKFLPADMAADPERRQRFFKEARAASALNHPHVCVVYDVGETEDGLPFIAMEYIEGGSLDSVVKTRRLEISQIVDLAAQVADALDAAHACRIVHRDIKPANISLNERGQVKVLDFGLAKRMRDRIARRVWESTTEDAADAGRDQSWGTPRYMSPEQALGKPLDQRLDLFSLGVVLQRTDHRPVAVPRRLELRRDPQQLCIPSPTAIARLNYDVPPELERITLKLLAKNVDRRYQSARDLLVDLKNLQRDLNLAELREDTAEVGEVRCGLGRQNASAEAAAGRSAPAAPPNPKDIAQSDVVITYANLDDQPVLSGRQGWVSQLHKNLQIRVVQLSGKQVAVVKQPDPSDSVEIEPAVLKHVPQAKTVVSVLSPPFARSNGCHRIVDTFWKSAHGFRPPGNRRSLSALERNQDPRRCLRRPPRRVRRRTPAWSPTSSSSATRPRAGCGSSTRHLATPRSSVSTSACTTSLTISLRCSSTWATPRPQTTSGPPIPRPFFWPPQLRTSSRNATNYVAN